MRKIKEKTDSRSQTIDMENKTTKKQERKQTKRMKKRALSIESK